MTHNHYILNPDHSVRIASMMEWAEAFKLPNRIVQQDQVGIHFVSTVFLGIDHNYSMEGPPLLFETMIFGKEKKIKFAGKIRKFKEEEYCERYSTWDEAVEGHARAIKSLEEK